MSSETRQEIEAQLIERDQATTKPKKERKRKADSDPSDRKVKKQKVSVINTINARKVGSNFVAAGNCIITNYGTVADKIKQTNYNSHVFTGAVECHGYVPENITTLIRDGTITIRTAKSYWSSSSSSSDSDSDTD